VLVHVTNDDIRNGECLSCHACPVALAIRRKLSAWRPQPGVSVGAQTIVVDGYRFVTPVRVTRFIRRFDGGDTVQPFAFRLRAEELKQAA
jgi:hypothetical protein